jgi:hypothetical protein
MKYKEYLPHSSLRDYVKCFWILEREYTADDPIEEVTPDAFVELILNFGTPYVLQTEGREDREMPGAFLVGLQQKPLMFRSGGTVRLVSTYDEAIEFYSKKLGFELQEDAAFGESGWVTLSLPDQRDVTIALERATTDDDRALVGKQGGRFAFLGMYGNRIFMSQEPQN